MKPNETKSKHCKQIIRRFVGLVWKSSACSKFKFKSCIYMLYIQYLIYVYYTAVDTVDDYQLKIEDTFSACLLHSVRTFIWAENFL